MLSFVCLFCLTLLNSVLFLILLVSIVFVCLFGGRGVLLLLTLEQIRGNEKADAAARFALDLPRVKVWGSLY